jgi:hypothetical protein
MLVSTRIIRAFRSAVLVIGLVSSLTAASSGLSGRWRIDLARSTELSPWKDYVLDIKIDGNAVTIDRRLAWGSREFADQLIVPAGETVTAPVVMWPDNRHLGAYISDAHTKHVRAEWLDDRRLLRLSTDLVLETQQGPRTVNILSDYKVSTNGTQLTLTELRSTRNRPIVYLFTRATEK